MNQRDLDLLEQEGWNVDCESPFVITHEESGSEATNIAAELILNMIKEENEGKMLKKEYQKRIDELNEYMIKICPTPTFERQAIIGILYGSIVSNYGR